MKHASFAQNHGFTFIELMVTIAIISIISVTFLGLFTQTLRFVQVKRIQVHAAALATEQMELVRNLSFNDVGTQGGIPSGVIPQHQILSRGSINFVVDTDIFYVDDIFDGTLGGTPNDTLNTDYKQVKITVSWDTPWGADSMFFLTNVSPKGIETNAGGGTLRINIFDASGVPVPQAEVDVVNTIEGVNLQNILTSDTGMIVLPGSPASVDNYQITAAKSNFSLDRTYGINDPLGNVTPDQRHQSVFTGATTEVSFQIDLLSQLRINTFLYQGIDPALPLSLAVSVTGGKIIGEDAASNPVFKYSAQVTTDAAGGVLLNPIEWDTYTITFPEAAPNYNIIEYSPPIHPISVLPNTASTITFLFAEPYVQYSLLVTVLDINNSPLFDVSVHLTKTSFYDTTLTTGASGQVFFGGLPGSGNDYTITLSKPLYTPITNTLSITGNNEYKDQMSLVP